MEDSWLLSTPMPQNADTPTLETKETKTQKELYIVINEMTNTLKHFEKKIEQQNEDSSNRISQLEACLTATLDEFEHCIRQTIPTFTEKEEIGMLKSEIETLKEENSKLRHDMYEKDISIKRLTETLNEEMDNRKWQTETRQPLNHQSRQNIPLDTRNRFAPLQNTQDEVLDKEAKNYKEKESLQHCHQTPIYRKQNHRPNPVINHYPENDNPFWQQRTVPGNSKYSDTVRMS